MRKKKKEDNTEKDTGNLKKKRWKIKPPQFQCAIQASHFNLANSPRSGNLLAILVLSQLRCCQRSSAAEREDHKRETELLKLVSIGRRIIPFLEEEEEEEESEQWNVTSIREKRQKKTNPEHYDLYVAVLKKHHIMVNNNNNNNNKKTTKNNAWHNQERKKQKEKKKKGTQQTKEKLRWKRVFCFYEIVSLNVFVLIELLKGAFTNNKKKRSFFFFFYWCRRLSHVIRNWGKKKKKGGQKVCSARSRVRASSCSVHR